MERVLTNKANWLAAHGHEVMVVTTDQRGRAPYFPLHPAVQTFDLGINYDETNGRLLRKLLTFPLKQWHHRRRLSKLLRQLRADVVVCMFNNDVSFVYQIDDGSRKFLEIHFSKNKKLQYARHGLWRLADRWRTRHEEWLVARYDRFVVLTHEDAALWGNLPNIRVIPNARTFASTVPSTLRQRRILAIGRYDHQKGFDTLLYIWHLLEGHHNGWTLDIVGDGPMRQELERLVVQWNMTDSVHLLPPTDDVSSLYLGASVLAMASRYEGLPMVLLEAQACGLPIVAFACQCGPRDIIHDGIDGFLVSPEQNDLFANRLLQLMQDADLRQRMGHAAFVASDTFSEERIMRQWEEIL